ncbi:hypothetical protein VPG91_22620 [Nitrospirillum amazonense]|uniref:hypothetical protein n=1 Tax=Nitrospirillum amazonense TaxID=28077 RepID=UPI002DD4222C|nr:hypothetical protein [Nitrospirillum amazonense]MEC4593812.1 hypothetical protein [Nitrospirillum amazonense]
MRNIFRIVALGVTMVSSVAALAETGNNEQLLRKALQAVAQGQCPADIMSPMLRGSCMQGMPGFGQTVASLGAIGKADYMGTQQTPMGPAEVYRVIFANGSMMWMINTGPDGKAIVFWSPGPQ